MNVTDAQTRGRAGVSRVAGIGRQIVEVAPLGRHVDAGAAPAPSPRPPSAPRRGGGRLAKVVVEEGVGAAMTGLSVVVLILGRGQDAQPARTQGFQCGAANPGGAARRALLIRCPNKRFLMSVDTATVRR